MVAQLWNHAPDCGNELRECDCGLPDVLALMHCHDCDAKDALIQKMVAALKEVRDLL